MTDRVVGQLDWVPPAVGANGALYFGSTADYPILTFLNYAAPGEVPPRTSPRFYALFE